VEEVARFLDALRATRGEERRRVLVVAGADFSHVGPRFGDPEPLDPEHLARTRERDLDAIQGATRGGARSFFESVARHRNAHRICSVNAIYSTLRTVGAVRGDLLDYDQSVAPDHTLAVTYAGIALYAAAGSQASGGGLRRCGSTPSGTAP
jgi:AmmeMemoRadiSam system protein B